MEKVEELKAAAIAYYQAHGRHDLPWRQPEPDGSFDPYKILVSEIMLQQTQVSRVIPKYREFLSRFPSFEILAAAPLGEVLKVWNGLGYNRRAKYLWQAAQKVASDYRGQLPDRVEALTALPGIGANTAGAILAYAFNLPRPFIETNIRTVFIYHCYADAPAVSDRQILDLVSATLPAHPREWYWALMDYGSHLKQAVGNLNMLSKHYTKQSRFEGSRRQIRGQILRLLAQRPHTNAELSEHLADERLAAVLQDLEQEGFITPAAQGWRLQ